MDTLSRYALGIMLLIVSLAIIGQLIRYAFGYDITYQLVLAFVLIIAFVIFSRALKLLFR